MKSGGPLKRNTPLSRRTPLQAKTQLRATQPLARIIQLRPVGKGARRIATFYDQCRARTMERAAGKCEMCGNPALSDPHHVFGRSLGIPGGRRWLYVPEMMLGVCRTCHDDWHDERVVLFGHHPKNHWRLICLQRLALRYGFVVPTYEGDTGMSLMAAARYCVQQLVESGVEPQP